MKGKTDKNVIEKLYLDGYDASQIAKKLKINIETIRKCIQRNFSHLKRKHEIAIIQRRETLRAINYEATKYMGNSTFIKKNRTIYETKSNGDIVINKEVAPVVTWDTPKKLINDDSNELYEKRLKKQYRDTNNELLN